MTTDPAAPGRLAGRVGIVTGGARGIGAATARAIVREGGAVVVADLLAEEGADLAADLGASARFAPLDVSDPEQWPTVRDVAVEAFGHLDLLVNNAGISGRRRVQRYPLEDFRRVLDVNLTGPFLGIQTCADALIASAADGADSAIVNVSSIQGLRGTPHAHGYVASKFGLRGLTKSVALELAPHGVRVNSIHPGHIKTPMVAHYPDDLIPIPLGRPGLPEEVAELVVLLASAEASYATGAEFPIDGGTIQGIPHNL